MKWLFVFMLICATHFATIAQNDFVSLSLGSALPVGKELKNSFSVGGQVGINYQKYLKYIYLEPTLQTTYFLGRHANYKDNLWLYSLNINVRSRKVKAFSMMVGGGYTLGKNLITEKGRFMGEKQKVASSRGFNLNFDVSADIRTLRISLGYAYHKPIFELNNSIKEKLQSPYQSALYGEVIRFEEQKFNFSYLFLKISKQIAL